MHTQTRRQKEVLDFITRYIDSHGYRPSYQVIAWHLGVASKAGIAKHVAALESQGLLARSRHNGSFNLEVCGKAAASESVSLIEWLDVPAPEGSREEWENEPLAVPRFMLGDYSADKIFAFRVADDSMSDKCICECDVALIEQRSFVRDGDCVIAVIKNRGAVLRNYYRDGSNIELRPANEGGETIRLAADKVEIKGVFRGLLRPVS